MHAFIRHGANNSFDYVKLLISCTSATITVQTHGPTKRIVSGSNGKNARNLNKVHTFKTLYSFVNTLLAEYTSSMR